MTLIDVHHVIRGKDGEFLNRRERRKQRKQLCALCFLTFEPVCCILATYYAVNVICGQFRIRLRRAALDRNPPESLRFEKILPRMARMARMGLMQDAKCNLDEAEKKKMMAADSALLRKFTELAIDETAEMRWQESRPMEAVNIDVGPARETDLQSDLIEASGNPF